MNAKFRWHYISVWSIVHIISKEKKHLNCIMRKPAFCIWLETHCPGILVTPRLFLFYLNKSDPIRILSH